MSAVGVAFMFPPPPLFCFLCLEDFVPFIYSSVVVYRKSRDRQAPASRLSGLPAPVSGVRWVHLMISHMNRSLAALGKADPARCGAALCLCAPPATPECQASADQILQREQISCEQELEIYAAESGILILSRPYQKR